MFNNRVTKVVSILFIKNDLTHIITKGGLHYRPKCSKCFNQFIQLFL